LAVQNAKKLPRKKHQHFGVDHANVQKARHCKIYLNL
jgi:hypothetical protein